jgi:putative component of membrane protein insertase Oxa1/YidC/SpoIIIJ protein YidD
MLRCTPAHVAATEQHDQEHEQHQKQHQEQHRATVDGATAVARRLSGPHTLRHGGSAYPPDKLSDERRTELTELGMRW